MKYRVDGKEIEVRADDAPPRVVLRSIAGMRGAALVKLGRALRPVHVAGDGTVRHVMIGSRRHTVEKVSRGRPGPGTTGAAAGPGAIEVPFACRLVAVLVGEGERVKAGTALFRVESMKMEQEITAPSDGIVSSIEAAPGDRLARGDKVMVLESRPEGKDQ